MDIAKSPFTAPFNRQMALWSEGVIAHYLRSKQDEIAAFAEDRGLPFEDVAQVCFDAATTGRVPDSLFQLYGIPPIEEVVVKEFIRDAILNVESVEETAPMRNLSEMKLPANAPILFGDALYEIVLDSGEDEFGLDNNSEINAVVYRSLKQEKSEGKHKASLKVSIRPITTTISDRNAIAGLRKTALDLGVLETQDFQSKFKIDIYDPGIEETYEADRDGYPDWNYSYTLKNVEGTLIRERGKYRVVVSEIGSVELEAKGKVSGSGKTRYVTRGDMEYEESAPVSEGLREIQKIIKESRSYQARQAERQKLYAPKQIEEARIERRPLGNIGSTGSAFNKGAATMDDLLRNMKK